MTWPKRRPTTVSRLRQADEYVRAAIRESDDEQVRLMCQHVSSRIAVLINDLKESKHR